MVTGGAGFIGSHLIDALMNSGKTVLCVDTLETGSNENVQHWIGNARFRFIRTDVADSLAAKGIESIYHLASRASPAQYQADPIRTLRTNVLGTLNMCDLAIRCGARLLLASTSEVYGDPQVHPQPETYWGNVNPVGPRSCYDEGKRAAETVCMDYSRQHNLDVRIGRIFNTYGPRMGFDDGRVVSNFITQCLKGERLTIYGDGSQTRSFCYVSDLVRGLIALMDSDVRGPVNLGNPEEFSIRDLATQVSDLVGVEPRFVNRDLPTDDPTRRRPDISRAKSLLGWSPEISLKYGLSRTIAEFRSRMDTM